MGGGGLRPCMCSSPGPGVRVGAKAWWNEEWKCGGGEEVETSLDFAAPKLKAETKNGAASQREPPCRKSAQLGFVTTRLGRRAPLLTPAEAQAVLVRAKTT